MLHTLYDSPKKTKILSDPRIIGPGIWVEMHLKTRYADTEQKKHESVNHIWFLAETFPCENCRRHINEYVNTHPFDHLWNLKNDKGEEIGMFKWSWMFHNAVNARLGKPFMDWNTAWEMYDIKVKPCTDCHDKDLELPPIQVGDTDKIIQGYFLKRGIDQNINRLS